MRSRPRVALTLLLTAVAATAQGCFGCGHSGQPRHTTAAPPAPPPADVHVSADLAASPESPPSMVGFLHTLANLPPPDRLVRPLHPKLWRGVPARAPYPRVAELGARYQLVLSDLWGYPATGWGGHGPPWRHLAGWARVVRRAALSMHGRTLEWDVWNEPDNPEYWTGTREQFFRVYEVAARTLAGVREGDLTVGGPSITKPRPDWLLGLIDYCRRRGCPVSFLSWHANLQPTQPIPMLAAELREVRAQAGRAGFTGPIEVNESVGPADQYRPGEILGFLHYLETGGAGAAARSCWPDAHGSDSCSNGTFEGLLTPAGQPRSAWWAYRVYAEGVGARVPSRSDSAAVASIASGGPRPQVVLARLDRMPAGAPPLGVNLTLRGLDRVPALAGVARAIVSVALLPDTGEAALPAPREVLRREIPLAGPTTLGVGALRPHEALVVAVSPG